MFACPRSTVAAPGSALSRPQPRPTDPHRRLFTVWRGFKKTTKKQLQRTRKQRLADAAKALKDCPEGDTEADTDVRPEVI